MQSTTLFATIGMLSALIGSPALAGDGDHERDQPRQRVADSRPAGNFNQRMLVVPNPAGPDERSHGWQYFSDPAALRAVVISPQGDYYFSRGKGLRWVAAAQPGV